MQGQLKPVLAAPIRLRQYDPKTMPAPALPAGAPTALLVCHGMGQQVPFETLDCIAHAICAAHDGAARVSARLVELDSDDSTWSRVEIELDVAGSAEPRRIHLYEAYWAPLTEGAIGYGRTAWFLVRAGWKGLVASFRRRFDRWMFGELRPLAVKNGTMQLLAALLLVLTPVLALAGLAFYLALHLLAGDSVGQVLEHPWWHGAGLLVLAASVFIRRFVLQYMGDVAIYVSSNEVNEFWRIRDEIKGICMRAANLVYRALEDQPGAGAPVLAYDKVVVVGHSLGSVVAYDTLNALFRNDQGALHGLRAVERSYALVTLGSPLDKTAFLFRQHVGHAVVREALAATVQPMIQSYASRPRWWVNVHARADIISGSLEYYDYPALGAETERVRNVRDPVFTLNPAAAHTGYWRRRPACEVLYRAACAELELLFPGQRR